MGNEEKGKLLRVHRIKLQKLDPDTDEAHDYISGSMSNEDLDRAIMLAEHGKDDDLVVNVFRKHAHILEAEKEMREEADFHDKIPDPQISIHAQDSGGPFYYDNDKVADNQIELAEWMKGEEFYPNVYVDQDGRGNPEILNFDPEAILIESEIEDEEHLEQKYKGYSFNELVDKIDELNDEMDNVADPSDMEEKIEEIEAEMARRLTDKKEFSEDGKHRSRSSGWSKLKQELPTSAAASNRLSEGGHSPQYTKVLEDLKRYWTKRGR